MMAGPTRALPVCWTTRTTPSSMPTVTACDGDIARAIFLDANGNDLVLRHSGGPGRRLHFQTLALAGANRYIIPPTRTYPGTVATVNGARVFGGYNRANRMVPMRTRLPVIIAGRTRASSLEVCWRPPASTGSPYAFPTTRRSASSSYGLLVIDSLGFLTVTNSVVEAGMVAPAPGRGR